MTDGTRETTTGLTDPTTITANDKIVTISTKQLQLADEVLFADDHTIGVCTVKQIKDGVVTLFRPYTHTGDFSWTGGVICYVGISTFEARMSEGRRWHLVTRKKLR